MALPPEVRQHGAGAVDVAEQVRLDDLPIGRLGAVLAAREHQHGSVVYPTVDPAKSLDRAAGERADLPFIRHVRRYSERLYAALFARARDLFQAPFAASGEDDRGAVTGEEV